MIRINKSWSHDQDHDQWNFMNTAFIFWSWPVYHHSCSYEQIHPKDYMITFLIYGLKITYIGFFLWILWSKNDHTMLCDHHLWSWSIKFDHMINTIWWWNLAFDDMITKLNIWFVFCSHDRCFDHMITIWSYSAWQWSYEQHN